jgi:nucleoside-diphosphate-sugar epimerase
MKICITGAASLVARKVIEVLADFLLYSSSPKTKKLVGSVLNKKFIEEALKGQDVVIHMAIANGTSDPPPTDEEKWKVNVKGTLIVVQEAVAAGVKKFIYTSSLSVFDGYKGFRETSGGINGITEGTEPKQASFYGLTKYLAEIIVKFYAENYKMKSIILRLISVYPEKGSVGWVKSVEPYLKTSARDVAQAFQLAVEKDLDLLNEVFHISGGHPQNPWSNEKAEKLLGYHPLDTMENI